jgi:hypothetical protein
MVSAYEDLVEHDGLEQISPTLAQRASLDCPARG